MASTDERIVWRLTKPKYAPGLDGEGARIAGGRWNSPGAPVVYCSETLALAVLECFVHLPKRLWGTARLPNMVAVRIALPEGAEPLAAEVDARADEDETRAMGDLWLEEARHLALRVPSAVVPQELNVLLNPLHPLARQIRVIEQTEFRSDPRMVG